jgi:DNA-binding MarR family transcriptional regulator
MNKKSLRVGGQHHALPDVALNFPLSASIAAMIRACTRLYTRALEERILPYGISIGVWFFLRALWEEDDVSQIELGERAGVRGPTIVTAMRRMETLGLIRRLTNSDDRRKARVMLTKKGRELRRKLVPVAVDVVHQGLRGMPKKEIEALRISLSRIQRNLKPSNE